MAQTFNRKTLQSGYSSVDLINENFEAIETALQDVLSRSGVSPNAMAADLDMNSNRILNLPTPVNGAEPATYAQLLNLATSGGLTLTGWAAEEQTATAGQAVFNLSLLAYVQGNNSLRVYINGVRQHSGFSETSTSSVTFDTGLQEGDKVLFEAFSVNLSTDAIDSSNVIYNHGGSGAVATNVKAKLQRVVHVEDFGAVGDGVSDDVSSFNAAMSAAGSGGKVLCTNGKTYKITGRVDCLANLDLCGATLNFVIAGNVECLAMRDNSSVKNGIITMNGTGTVTSGKNQCPIIIGEIDNDTPRQNVVVENIIIGSTSATGNLNGIFVTHESNNVTINNIKFNDSSTLGRPILVHWAPGPTSNDTRHPYNVNISNIYIGDMTGNYSDAAGILLSGTHNVNIENVYMEHVPKNGVTIYAGDDGYTGATTGFTELAMRNITVRNVIIASIDSNSNAGFLVNGTQGNSPGTDWYGNPLFERCVVKGGGNTVNGFTLGTSRGVRIVDCIAVECYVGVSVGEKCYQTKIIGGEYYSCALNGIRVTAGSNSPVDTTIDGTYCYLNNTAAGTEGGILVGTSSRTWIKDCTLGDISGTDGSQYYGVSISSAASGVKVNGCHFYAHKASGAGILAGTSAGLILSLSDNTYGGGVTPIVGQDNIPYASIITPDGTSLITFGVSKTAPTFSASLGSMTVAADTGIVYVNTSGSTTWTKVGVQT